MDKVQSKTRSADLASTGSLEKRFPEWILFEKLLSDLKTLGRVHELGRDSSGQFPLRALSFGSEDPQAPTLALFGGVHGLERIGAQVVLSLLQSFSELILWDRMLQQALARTRIVFFPLVNPWGILHHSRANFNGVDLMRNAPVECLEKPTFLVGGHRISPKLPWYRGSTTMESESQAIVDLVRAQMLDAKVAITLDFHSGFGVQDQIWFPFARSTRPFPNLAEMFSLKQSLDRTFPNHFYRIEPQSKHYTTLGDVWDHSYDLFAEHNKGRDNFYLPLSLEMGSWMWVKKNPLQLFSMLGPFNPMKPHRQKRILRRHQTLFDFLIRAMTSPESWTFSNLEQRERNQASAMELWYAK